MTRSVLEASIAGRCATWHQRLARHDRGVVLGFLLSLVPIPPIPFVGLALGLFHLKAFRDGRLSGFDHALARRGLFLAVVNSLLAGLLAALVIAAVRDAELGRVVAHLPSLLANALRWLLNLRGHALEGTPI